jgi:L,D-transpeptidase YcbB
MRHRDWLLLVPLLAGLLAGASHAQAGPAQGGPAPVVRAPTVQPALAAQPLPGREGLERFYTPRAYAPAWTRERAKAALALLRDAASEGLDPAEYGVEGLDAGLAGGDAPDLDVALTAAMLHYLSDLRLGRAPSDYHGGSPDPRRFDPVERLRSALASGDLAGAVHWAEPAFPLYARVRQALARYRALDGQPFEPLAAPASRKLKPGMPYRDAQALHERLARLGDLPDDAAPSSAVYDTALADGVRHFQARHGLEPDGVLGRETLAALNLPIARHVRQLELTLERLRWLPDFAPGPVIAVNVPSYRLWAFTAGAGPGADVLEMPVIVGAAVKTPTPLFIGQMRYLEFNPYWNVPRSITLAEVIPKLERDPAYLAREQMELVPLAGGAPTGAVNAATIGALREGRYRVRQRPGPKNALGAIKFAMPNPMDIYLHSTPARELFRRSRRDLSHGCIRVEDPVALAQFVLRDPAQWNAASIEAAMAPGPTRRVSLPAPIPVVLFYATAIVDREGRVLFPRDVYKRDPLLEHALEEHARQIVPSPPPPRE